MNSTYATRWYQTLFSEFPRELVLRIWDILFFEGVKILFRVAMAILVQLLLLVFVCRGVPDARWSHPPTIYATLQDLKALALMSVADEEELLLMLQGLPQDPAVSDATVVIDRALRIDITTKQIQKISNEFLESQ